MDDKILIEKVLSLEENIITLKKNQDHIVKETKESFSHLLKITKSLSSTLLKSMESDKVLDDLVTENDERLSEIEDKFEDFQEEITNKLAWDTDMNIEEIEKSLNAILDLIKFDRDAINAILNYIKEKDKITIWKVLSSISSLRGLLGVP